ncbi:MAG: sugar phosphate isomerase/epimerase [Planctomycetes bacterium]|nr:sugar phosphate isomerase/epimerase [Planctomycetota bacterium]
MQICCFSKSFQDLPLDKFCRQLYEMGFDGIDLTVRKGGSIEPADVEKKLPEAVKIIHEAGLKYQFLTTDIADGSAQSERTLATAASLGIDRVKLGYFRYISNGKLRAQIDETRKKLAEIAAVANKHRVIPCVHTHSGTYIPSHGTLLYELIRDFKPGEVGAYVDTLHMALEGGGNGWQQGLDLLAPWIALVGVKNFGWKTGERDKSGQQRWLSEELPLADGLSPLPDFFATLRRQGYDGVYSLHSEYKGKHSFRDMSTEECLVQTAADIKYFKSLFATR